MKLELSMENQPSIIRLISQIRECPTMYIGKHSVVRLNMYLLGWLRAHEDNVSDSDVYFDFLEALKRHYQIEASVPGTDVIELFTHDEREALEVFFSRFSEYLENTKGKYSP